MMRLIAGSALVALLTVPVAAQQAADSVAPEIGTTEAGFAAASPEIEAALAAKAEGRPIEAEKWMVAAANPLTAPRIELVALETATAQCANARRAYGCDPVAGPQRADAIAGCRRPADLFETASVAIGEAAAVARTANAMAQRLSTMLQGDGSGSAVDMAKVARNATETLAALNSLSTQLDRSFRPGQGDIALTLSHVRKATGRASEIDVAALNGILRETQAMVAQNQTSIAGLLAEGKGSASEARMILEGASASLIATSANLERTSASLGNLSERLAGDPTFAIRGQRYADPPPPGGKK